MSPGIADRWKDQTSMQAKRDNGYSQNLAQENQSATGGVKSKMDEQLTTKQRYEKALKQLPPVKPKNK